MPSERIVAVCLVTSNELTLLGRAFDRAWPVEETPCFSGLLQAIDEADRNLWRERDLTTAASLPEQGGRGVRTIVDRTLERSSAGMALQGGPSRRALFGGTPPLLLQTTSMNTGSKENALPARGLGGMRAGRSSKRQQG
jgi:hypothetical protein